MALPAAGRKILVIEDSDDTADSLATLLGLLGYRVDVARSGREGLAAAMSARPDAILLDIGMPAMNGYEVAVRLRAREEFGDVPIVAITGLTEESDRRRSAGAGIDHHLVKPCDVVELMKLLGDHAAVGRLEPRRAIGSTAVASKHLADSAV
jgi:CheY-like chemotaxis protein